MSYKIYAKIGLKYIDNGDEDEDVDTFEINICAESHDIKNSSLSDLLTKAEDYYHAFRYYPVERIKKCVDIEIYKKEDIHIDKYYLHIELDTREYKKIKVFKMYKYMYKLHDKLVPDHEARYILIDCGLIKGEDIKYDK